MADEGVIPVATFITVAIKPCQPKCALYVFLAKDGSEQELERCGLESTR